MKHRISQHIDVTWLSGRIEHDVRCPNCSFLGTVQQLIEIDYQPSAMMFHHFKLRLCSTCEARFVDNPETMNYSGSELIDLGWDAYQVQLGAGLSTITAPLARILKPRGSKILEIGGAYGFGLDFCIRARGWRGEGFDPSPLSLFGAKQLGLTIHQSYFEREDLVHGPYDLALATEVIEHIAKPPEFLKLMRAALADDGILVLTTPDAEKIASTLPGSELLPLLSPGAHLVLQTSKSLRVALIAAGFQSIQITREGNCLTAYASGRQFELDQDFDCTRKLYRLYLTERAELTDPVSDLNLGFLGRAIFEAVNDSDFATSEAAWTRLRFSISKRFDLDVETMTELPSEAPAAELAELINIMPLNLGMILYARAMHMLATGQSRISQEARLRLAQSGIDALLTALGKRSLTDGLSQSISNAIYTELTLCAVEKSDIGSFPEVLLKLQQKSSPSLVWRCFVTFMSLGYIESAEMMLKELGIGWPTQDLSKDLYINSLISLGNLALSPQRDALQAIEVATKLREHNAVLADEIVLQSFTRLVDANRYGEARQIKKAHDVESIALRSIVTSTKSVGIVANAVLGNEDQTKIINVVHAVDALKATMQLEVHGEGALSRITQLIQRMRKENADEERQNEVILAAFVALVNAKEHTVATVVRDFVEPLLVKMKPPFRNAEQDALFAFGMLAVHDERYWARGSVVLARLRDDIVKHHVHLGISSHLFWPALRGEVICLNCLKRTEEANELLTHCIKNVSGAPADLCDLVTLEANS